MLQVWQINKLDDHHDDVHLHPLTNVPTEYEPSTPFGIQEIVWTKFSISRSLQEDQRSNQDHTMMLHTYTTQQCYTSQPMSLPSINFLIVSKM